MTQLSLEVPGEQLLTTTSGAPVTGALARDAKQLGHPIKCCLCPPQKPPPAVLVFLPDDGGRSGLLVCHHHAPRREEP